VILLANLVLIQILLIHHQRVQNILFADLTTRQLVASPINKENKKLSGGATAGIVIGVIVGIVLVAGLIILFIVWRKRQNQSNDKNIEMQKRGITRSVSSTRSQPSFTKEIPRKSSRQSEITMHSSSGDSMEINSDSSSESSSDSDSSNSSSESSKELSEEALNRIRTIPRTPNGSIADQTAQFIPNSGNASSNSPNRNAKNDSVVEPPEQLEGNADKPSIPPKPDRKLPIVPPRKPSNSNN